MNAPLISCIVPTFNSSRYLAEALDSILGQSYRPLDVLVADDGSTDTTADIVAAYGDRIRFVSQATAGPAATRNLGLHSAAGDFVAFLDADDLWHPEKLSLQMNRFSTRSELDLCITHAQVFWSEELASEEMHYRDHRRAKPLPGYATTTLLARRRIFDKIGDFNTELWFGDATEWFMRVAEAGAVMEVLPDVLTYHRLHPSNLTRRRSDMSRDEFLRIVKGSLDRRREAEKQNARLSSRDPE